MEWVAKTKKSQGHIQTEKDNRPRMPLAKSLILKGKVSEAGAPCLCFYYMWDYQMR